MRISLTPNAHCFSAECFSTIIAALGTAGRVDDAERYFGQMAQLGVVPTAESLNAIISRFAGRASGKAEHWFAKITAVGRLKPNVISYSALIQANAVRARPDRALALLHEMTHKGVRPDVVSYHQEELFRQMVRQGVRPDVKTFGSLIDGRGRARKHPLEQMSAEFQLSPNTEIYNVRRTLDHMLQAGVQPSHATFSIVIDAAGFPRLPHEAEHHAMASLHGLHPNANNFTSLIEALARNGQLDKAEAILDSLTARKATSALEHDRLTAKSFNTLLGFCIGADDAARGQRVEAKMHQAGVEPNEVTQANLLDLARLSAAAQKQRKNKTQRLYD